MTKDVTKENDISVYGVAEYIKSNFLISGKYKSTLMENKLLAIFLANINNVVEEHGLLYSRMKASDLRKMLNGNQGSFYSQLNKAANSLTGKSIGMSDPESKVFDYMTIIVHATYDKGVMTMKFNPEIKDYIHDIKKNFTRLQLPIMLSFDCVYSFRLYEILKSKAYYPKGTKHMDGVFVSTFLLSELKLNLGVVNADLDGVKKVLKKNKNPDFDKAVSVASEKVLDEWGDFKKVVLEPAMKEINEKTDIEISYTPIRGGNGGRIYEIEFIIKTNSMLETEEDVVELSEEEKLEFIDKISKFFAEQIRFKDLVSIAKAAHYDFKKVVKAQECLKQQKQKVENEVGWLITAIKKDFHVNTQKDAKQKNPFLRMIESPTYAGKSNDELEEMILKAHSIG